MANKKKKKCYFSDSSYNVYGGGQMLRVQRIDTPGSIGRAERRAWNRMQRKLEKRGI